MDSSSKKARKDQDDKDEKSQSRWCGVCSEKLAIDHHGIRCKSSHHLCEECSGNYKDGVMKDACPDLFPPKCGFCACEIDLPSFERHLTDAQRDMYLSMMVLKQLPDDEVLVSCPFCPFFCTRVVGENGSAAEALFMHCMGHGCQKVSCTLCMKECVACEDADMEDEAATLGMAAHFECAEKDKAWGMIRRKMEEAIETGIKFPCPTCGHRGVKDDACSHMTCDSCHTVWCYICGLDTTSDACGKAPGESNPEYRHNVNWHTNPDRCPMYLSEICQVDGSWPGDDEEAKEHLHRLRTLRNLRSVYNDMGGQDVYRQLVAEFPKFGSASGFDEEAIRAVDLTAPLFARSDDFMEDDE